MHAGRVAERKRMGGHRLPGDVAPEIDDREAARGEHALHLCLVEEGVAIRQRGAISVVDGRRLRQVAQPLRRTGQRVVAVHDVRGSLHLLPALDAAPAATARRRADVVVEGGDMARAARLPDDVDAVRVVAAHDLVVVEKVDVGSRQGAFEQLEAVGGQRPVLRFCQAARVMHRHLAIFRIGAVPAGVIAIAVPAREHLAVAIERALDGRRQVAERADPSRTRRLSPFRAHGCHRRLQLDSRVRRITSIVVRIAVIGISLVDAVAPPPLRLKRSSCSRHFTGGSARSPLVAWQESWDHAAQGCAA